MSTFSKLNFKTINYNSFRPHYPAGFYKILSNYVSDGTNSNLPIKKGIDLGCGTGVAAYPLLNFVDEVTGLDLSPPMIDTAKSLISERCEQMNISDTSRINFKVGAAEDFVKQENEEFAKNSVDLIVAAQCIHWFQDLDSFYGSCASLLKKGGTLAYWYYVDPIIIDFLGPPKGDKIDTMKKAIEIYNKYVYEDPKYMGPHWEQPGRNILRDLCVKVNDAIPKDLYTDIAIKTYCPDFDGNLKPSDNDLVLERLKISINDFLAYVLTYSGYHNFKEVTGDKCNLAELFISEWESELGWDRNETTIDIVWRSGYTFMKKK